MVQADLGVGAASKLLGFSTGAVALVPGADFLDVGDLGVLDGDAVYIFRVSKRYDRTAEIKKAENSPPKFSLPPARSFPFLAMTPEISISRLVWPDLQLPQERQSFPKSWT
jgi:hypothetical protein